MTTKPGFGESDGAFRRLRAAMEQQGLDAQIIAAMILSYHPARNLLPRTRPTGLHDNIVIHADGAEWLSGSWDPGYRRIR